MAGCASCGAALPEMARFCSSCGLPTTQKTQDVDLFLLPDDFNRPQEADVATVGRAKTTNRVVKPTIIQTIGLAVTTVAFVAVVWAPNRAEVDNASRAAARIDPGPAAGPIAKPGDTGDAGVELGRNESSDVTDFFDGDFTSDVFADLSVVGPLLDNEVVGYRLVASSESQLFDIDLDTGELTRHQIEADLVGFSDQELVVFNPNRGFLGLPVDDLGANGRTIFTVPEETDGDRAVAVDNLLVASIRSPATLQAEFLRPDPTRGLSTNEDTDPGPYGTQLYEVDIAKGRFAATTIAVDPRPGTPDRTRHGLAALAGGGLFEAKGNSYQQLAEGHALLMGVNYAIVRQCLEPGRCRVYWLDRATGEEVDRPLPSAVNGDVESSRTATAVAEVTELDENAKVILVAGPEEQFYFDVENGRRLATLDPLSLTFAQGPLGRPFGALSPDGRWMALPVGGSIVFYDRQADLLYRRGSGPSAKLEQFLFVPNGRR